MTDKGATINTGGNEILLPIPKDQLYAADIKDIERRKKESEKRATRQRNQKPYTKTERSMRSKIKQQCYDKVSEARKKIVRLKAKKAADEAERQRFKNEIVTAKKALHECQEYQLLLNVCLTVWPEENIQRLLDDHGYQPIDVVRQFVSVKDVHQREKFLAELDKKLGELERRDDKFEESGRRRIYDTLKRSAVAWKAVFDIDESQRVAVDDPPKEMKILRPVTVDEPDY
uniref:BZIP domain-containing protein n=1 Tax=Panagrolaimus sp. PS1159 TaxID=55785 RepID=A0AC35GQX3_9BILA